ncbi:hypothetical protein MasN3_47510 [Massilia varians]|uniref:KfrA N-terminal DNA-binding domain-containing protein n=1 Tax=Massilia varians TaxID=457921 RepID=A0ABM8CD73_9BURK|nr:hypothetical protein [Massilia varians]BDT61257.1 hypothetical protein MasN3_47510 [Massilia varians]
MEAVDKAIEAAWKDYTSAAAQLTQMVTRAETQAALERIVVARTRHTADRADQGPGTRQQQRREPRPPDLEGDPAR